jgi:hypothetical protein
VKGTFHLGLSGPCRVEVRREMIFTGNACGREDAEMWFMTTAVASNAAG